MRRLIVWGSSTLIALLVYGVTNAAGLSSLLSLLLTFVGAMVGAIVGFNVAERRAERQ